jgi:large subunit ribosomal protein L5
MADTAYTPRLRAQFDKEIRGKLTEQFGYANVMQVPRLDKVVLNMGVGDAVNDRKKAETAAGELTQIAGQKAIVTYSRVAIATFKLRENQPIGCKVTLRKAKMYEFIDRLVNVALPRVRDFRGLNRRASTAAAITRSASRSTSFSPKSISTRFRKPAAWTSRSAPRRRPTTRRVPC